VASMSRWIALLVVVSSGLLGTRGSFSPLHAFGAVWDSSGHAGSDPQYNAVPCGHVIPSAVTTSWHIARATVVHTAQGKAITRVQQGRRTLRRARAVARLYHEVCDMGLIKYAHPVAIACPAATGAATYHLVFVRGRGSVLRVTEDEDGCQFVWIDGHRNLGYGFGVVYLPPGVPTLAG
jgi:hypothetical protein